MKQKRKLTFGEKCCRFFGEFGIGADFWALGLLGIFVLPNLIWWCYSPANDPLRRNGRALDLYIAAFVFLMLALALLSFFLRGERKKPRFDSACFLFGVLAILLYYAAWIFYFCSYINFAVFLFFAVFPGAAAVLFIILRRHWIALVPAGIFAVLNFACYLILVLIYV